MAQNHENLLVDHVLPYGELALRDKHYDRHFNPNLCHFCKCIFRSDNLQSCTGCQLVFYCCYEHRRKHYTESHGEICEIVTRSLARTPATDSGMDRSEWIESRKLLLEKVNQEVQQNLKRPLKMYEKQMILRARNCLVCCRRNNLQTCKHCFSVNCCPLHVEELRTTHEHECAKLEFLHNIGMCKMSFKGDDLRYDTLFLHGFINIAPENLMSSSTYEIIHQYLPALEPPTILAEMKDFILSDYISVPLTIYSGFSSPSLSHLIRSKLVIHIIGVDSIVDTNVFRSWEILFHLSSELQELIIIYIGSGLDSVCDIELCNFCKQRKKELYVICEPMLYYQYLQTSCDYRQPDIILGLVTEPQYFQWHIPCRSVHAIIAQNCPFLISSSGKEASYIFSKIEEAMCGRLKLILQYENPFFSFVPYNSLKEGVMEYTNDHVAIFYHLHEFR